MLSQPLRIRIVIIKACILGKSARNSVEWREHNKLDVLDVKAENTGLHNLQNALLRMPFYLYRVENTITQLRSGQVQLYTTSSEQPSIYFLSLLAGNHHLCFIFGFEPSNTYKAHISDIQALPTLLTLLMSTLNY